MDVPLDLVGSQSAWTVGSWSLPACSGHVYDPSAEENAVFISFIVAQRHLHPSRFASEVIVVAADVLALTGARTSAGTTITSKIQS